MVEIVHKRKSVENNEIRKLKLPFGPICSWGGI